MVKLVLGPWYEPTIEDHRLLFYLLDFIRLRWKDPEVYEDYWTEFTAPILQIDELLSGFDTKTIVREAESFIQDGGLINSRYEQRSLTDSEQEFSIALNRIRPVALGRGQNSRI
jgi:hypothetical protein